MRMPGSIPCARAPEAKAFATKLIQVMTNANSISKDAAPIVGVIPNVESFSPGQDFMFEGATVEASFDVVKTGPFIYANGDEQCTIDNRVYNAKWYRRLVDPMMENTNRIYVKCSKVGGPINFNQLVRDYWIDYDPATLKVFEVNGLGPGSKNCVVRPNETIC
jgi:hypothetical protein